MELTSCKNILTATSPGTTIGLDLRTMLYIGGIDPDIKLPQSLGINNGMKGCVAEVSFTC